MQRGVRASIGLVVLVVVFGSGWIIYGWNKLQGKDLSNPPRYDATVDAKYFEAFAILDDANNANTVNANSANTGDVSNKQPVEFQFMVDNIYFKNSFRVDTAAGTELMIRDFLKDFPELKGVVVENLEAPTKFDIELPVLGRERMMTALTRNKEVVALKAKEAPVWELELKSGKYESEVVEFLKNFKDVKLVTKFPANLEYIAKINIAGQKEKLAETLANLEKNYSDVVTVK